MELRKAEQTSFIEVKLEIQGWHRVGAHFSAEGLDPWFSLERKKWMKNWQSCSNGHMCRSHLYRKWMRPNNCNELMIDDLIGCFLCLRNSYFHVGPAVLLIPETCITKRADFVKWWTSLNLLRPLLSQLGHFVYLDLNKPHILSVAHAIYGFIRGK